MKVKIIMGVITMDIIIQHKRVSVLYHKNQYRKNILGR